MVSYREQMLHHKDTEDSQRHKEMQIRITSDRDCDMVQCLPSG
jgi:hypothetical protein